jgi:hypothetical protein
LAAARLRYIAGTAWSAKCYMNMRPLYQHDQAGKADYPSAVASSCDGSNRTQAVEGTCWTAAEDTCWMTVADACWHSE